MNEQQQREARERLEERQRQYDDGQPVVGILEREWFFAWLKARYPEAQDDARLALDALDRVRALAQGGDAPGSDPWRFKVRAALDGPGGASSSDRPADERATTEVLAAVLAKVRRLPGMDAHVTELLACEVCRNPKHAWHDRPHADHRTPVVSIDEYDRVAERMQAAEEQLAALARLAAQPRECGECGAVVPEDAGP